MKKTGLITESYVENGVKKKRVRLFEFDGQKFMATWEGKLIPHECAICLLNRIFRDYGEEPEE